MRVWPTQEQQGQKRLAGGFRRAAAILAAVLPFSLAACRKPVAPSASAPAWEDSYGLCFHGCPTGAPASNRVIQRPVYALSNNGRTKFADWVAYVVTAETIGHTKKRVWHTDPDLPAGETLSPQDYKGARAALGVDRGHQAPLASLTGTPWWDLADDLSNVTPMEQELNEGPWERLEQAERNAALAGARVYGETGPLYEREMPKLPHAHLDHEMPSGYWKVVAVEQGDEIELAAFIMDQTLGRDADFCATTATVRDIEAHSRLDLMPGLDRARQDRLETAPGALLPKLGCGR